MPGALSSKIRGLLKRRHTPPQKKNLVPVKLFALGRLGLRTGRLGGLLVLVAEPLRQGAEPPTQGRHFANVLNVVLKPHFHSVDVFRRIEDGHKNFWATVRSNSSILIYDYFNSARRDSQNC